MQELEMTDQQLAEAIAAQEKKTADLREKQALLKQQTAILEIAKLQSKAKEHDDAVAAENLALEQIARNQLERKQKQEAKEKIQAAERQRQAVERQELEAKEAEVRRIRADKELSLRKATERAFAEEQETKRLQYLLDHPRIAPVEPKPVQLTDAGHPLSLIFGSKGKTEEKVPEISLAENLKLAAQEPAQYSTPRYKRTVDGNQASALQQSWRKQMNGEYPNSADCITLLEKVSYEEIMRVFPLMREAHIARPMSIAGMIHNILLLIDPAFTEEPEVERPVDRMSIKSVAKPQVHVAELYAEYLHRVEGLPDFHPLSQAEWARQTNGDL